MTLWGVPALRDFGLMRDPFALLKDLQREMNSVFDGYSGAEPAGFPALNVWLNGDQAKVMAELPGLAPSDIDITVSGRALTIKGERKAGEEGAQAKYHRRERGYGEFVKTIELPFPIDADKVEAAFGKGILTLTLPRTESDKPRKIAVNAHS